MMLKSTHRPIASLPPLPSGWTEHKAPTGHSYYFNATTKQSTYTRPLEAQPTIQQSFAAVSNPRQGKNQALFDGYSDGTSGGSELLKHTHSSQWDTTRGREGFRGGYNDRPRPALQDRPKSKYPIPDCAPWLLVKTKFGRRFVYNPEKRESFWKFPLDVMKGVVEFDRQGRERQSKKEAENDGDLDQERVAAFTELTKVGQHPAAASAPVARNTATVYRDNDSEEYEEVEVTDNEDDENPSKRQKTGHDEPDQPVEFNEDDIAYQLAAMGEDYGLDPGEYGVEQDEGLQEGAEGLTLTEEDANALFKDMLDEYNVSPYAIWEKVIEGGHIVEDERYTVLPNMKFRKEVFSDWSRDRIQQLKEQREREEKKDPRIPYFSFLQSHATPKLYWPEFRRKYQKEVALRDGKLSDKEREKAYRGYINRLKLPESTLKSDLVSLLKSIPLHTLNRSTPPDALPPIMLSDLRYISIRPSVRDPLIEAHIAALPPAPVNLDISPGGQELLLKQRDGMERRDRALAERQKQVQDEKRRQKGALQFSKGMLREGEEEIERALRVGKEGLRGYMEAEE